MSQAVRLTILGRKSEEDGLARCLCLLIRQLRGKWCGSWHTLSFGESAKEELLELWWCISGGLEF